MLAIRCKRRYSFTAGYDQRQRRDTVQHTQVEFYDYYANNYGETRNQAFNSGWAWNATAGEYLNAYNNIMAGELYNIYPKIQAGYNAALNAYLNVYLNENSTAGGCGIETWPPSKIPAP